MARNVTEDVEKVVDFMKTSPVFQDQVTSRREIREVLKDYVTTETTATTDSFHLELNVGIGGSEDEPTMRVFAYVVPALKLWHSIAELGRLYDCPPPALRIFAMACAAQKANNFKKELVERNAHMDFVLYQKYIQVVHPEVIPFCVFEMDTEHSYDRAAHDYFQQVTSYMEQDGQWLAVAGEICQMGRNHGTDDEEKSKWYAMMHPVGFHEIVFPEVLFRRWTENGLVESEGDRVPDAVISIGGSPEERFNKVRAAVSEVDLPNCQRPRPVRLMTTVGHHPVYYNYLGMEVPFFMQATCGVPSLGMAYQKKSKGRRHLQHDLLVLIEDFLQRSAACSMVEAKQCLREAVLKDSEPSNLQLKDILKGVHESEKQIIRSMLLKKRKDVDCIVDDILNLAVLRTLGRALCPCLELEMPCDGQVDTLDGWKKLSDARDSWMLEQSSILNEKVQLWKASMRDTTPEDKSTTDTTPHSKMQEVAEDEDSPVCSICQGSGILFHGVKDTTRTDPCPLCEEAPVDAVGSEEEKVLQSFQRLGIVPVVHRHEPIISSEDFAISGLEEKLGDSMVKCLVMRDKKKNFYLFATPWDAHFDIKALGQVIDVKGLQMAREEHLEEILGLSRGNVNPFVVMNVGADKIKLLIDQRLKDVGFLSAHPMHNTATITVPIQNMLDFAQFYHHSTTWVQI